MRPKISVCVATYNQRTYIADCVLSVLAQECDADVEILVGDDSSRDGTDDVLRGLSARHPGRLTIVRRTLNLGASRNYQDLLARATGDYIAHLDGDDFWLPGKLAAQLDFLDRHQNCAAVYTNAFVVGSDGAFSATFTGRQPEEFDTTYLLRGRNFLNHSSLLYRAEFKDSLLAMGEEFIDYRMHLRLSMQGALGFINRHLVVYRAAVATSMVNSARDRVQEMYLEALCDPALRTIQRTARRRALSTMLGDILVDAALSRRLSFALYWIGRTRSAAKGNGVTLVLSAIFASTKQFVRLGRRRIGETISGHRNRVAHER